MITGIKFIAVLHSHILLFGTDHHNFLIARIGIIVISMIVVGFIRRSYL
ncbi:hypothetical protein MGSAQ_000483 [marine sediment metagenome]|uniref:Uncharacterized protein n=1 Tax=marine sediment metagenome TaxID=412755 RepID=A0A1B6NXD1_9ZZZZ